jgi:hypothetical protein
MRQEEVCDALIRVDLVFYTRETVAFVFVNFVIDSSAALFDGIDHLLRFGFRAARIVASSQQQ